jgi:riboflavin kinase / FMN adenylyltransferase
MEVHTVLNNLPNFKNAVVTIGSYDGVHTGHQAIIQRINEFARLMAGESVLITFHPHPRMVIKPDEASLKIITNIEEKTALFEQFGLNHLVIVPFTEDFSKQSPEEYIRDFLVKKFQPKIIVIGYDHKFGNKRSGNITFLKSRENVYGFKVMEIAEQEVDSIVVSSTKIRNALNSGNIQQANEWLNHRFTLTGEVIYGKQIGRTIHYPTANLQIDDKYKLIPPQGIYAVRVFHQSEQYNGMLYIGNRPTLDGVLQSIEVNIFDFDKMIYGDFLTIEFIAKIREDQKFDGLDALQRQLALDKEATLKILGEM